MTLSVRFMSPIDGGGGRVDPLRIVKDVPFTSGTDGMSPNVLFTAISGLPAFAEAFSAQTAGKPAFVNALEGVWNTGRQYKSSPLLLASYVDPNGALFMPGFSNSSWWFKMTVKKNSDNSYNIAAGVYVGNPPAAYSNLAKPAPGGVLRVYVLGQVA